MKYHEYANIYNMLTDEKMQNLAVTLKRDGQLIPITIYEGKILDGRNRYEACKIAGIECHSVEYTGDDPLQRVSNLNDHRRHDSTNQLALTGAKMANLRRGGQGGKLKVPMGTLKSAITQERAAELTGASLRNIKRAKPIVENGIPELEEMTRNDQVSIRAASTVAKLPEEEQREAVSKGADGIKEAAKKQRDTPVPRRIFPSPKPQHGKVSEWVPDDAERIWAIAQAHLDRILPNDTSLTKVMNNLIAYAEARISKTK